MSLPDLADPATTASDEHASAADTNAEAAQALAWLQPAHRAAPADALARIRAICEQPGNELYPALLLVLATHQAVPRDILAAAVKQFRRDCDALTREDVTGLLNAIANSSAQAFDAVLRSRKSSERKSSSMSWVKD